MSYSSSSIPNDRTASAVRSDGTDTNGIGIRNDGEAKDGGSRTHRHHRKHKRSKHRSRNQRRLRKDGKSRRYDSDEEDDRSDVDREVRRRRRKKRKKEEKKKRRSESRRDDDRSKRRKRKRTYSSSSSSASSYEYSSSSSSTSSTHRRRKKKRKRGERRKQHCDVGQDRNNGVRPSTNENETAESAVEIPLSGEQSKSTALEAEAGPASIPAPSQPKRKPMIPMSKEEYDKEQSKIREVYDPLSGRVRLVKGSGEIIERIVSSATHRQINSLATSGDGLAFSKGVYEKLRR